MVEALRAADLNKLTPLEAMNLLAALQKQLSCGWTKSKSKDLHSEDRGRAEKDLRKISVSAETRRTQRKPTAEKSKGDEDVKDARQKGKSRRPLEIQRHKSRLGRGGALGPARRFRSRLNAALSVAICKPSVKWRL